MGFRKFSFGTIDKFTSLKTEIMIAAKEKCAAFREGCTTLSAQGEYKSNELKQFSEFETQIAVELQKLIINAGSITKQNMIDAIRQTQIKLASYPLYAEKFPDLALWLNNTLSNLIPPPPNKQNESSPSASPPLTPRSPSPSNSQ